MKHAFLITAYTDPVHLRDLIDRLDNKEHLFFIHIDAKSTLHRSQEAEALRNHPRVRLLKKPVRVYWGGFSHFRAILMLLQEAVRESKADYFHLLSGQCYPIYDQAKFNAYFEKHAGSEFMTAVPIEQLNWTGGSLNRLQLFHLNDFFNIRVRFWKRINSRFLQLQRALGFKRKLPLPYPHYFGGGTWWSLTAAASAHIVRTFEMNPALLQSLKHTHCAEEIVLQTIVGNSPFKDKLVQNDLRFVDWSTRDGNCPVVLDARDFDAVVKSDKLIARKFVSGISDSLKARLRQ